MVRIGESDNCNHNGKLMESQKQETPFVERRKTGPSTEPRERRKAGPVHEGPVWTGFLWVITALLAAGLIYAHPPQFAGISTKSLYKPGDDLGYNIGLAGGLMMLIMLLYPLRKRIKFMKDLGILPTWFRWHMVLGILGPTLVMFHSTFIINSINAGVAMACMMLVSGSGIFGRFFYTKIHNGLYGRQITLKGMHEELARTGSFRRSFMDFAPEIEHSMERFRVRAEGGQGGLGNFLWVGFQAAFLSRSLTKELHRIMYEQAHEKKLDTEPLKQGLDKLYEEYATNIRTYLKALRDTSQFHTYERLFSLWHVFHIPLVYMMLFSGVYHVISVHMY
jgi:hypothetical protein